MFGSFLFAQDSKLAQQYYMDGEFEKASLLYQKLYLKNANFDYFFGKYIECMLYLEEFGQAEKDIKKMIKQHPESTNLYVSLGNLYEIKQDSTKAKDAYNRAIENMQADRYRVIKMGQEFSKLGKYDLAVLSYEKGEKILKTPMLFDQYIADVYRRQGNKEQMIYYYLNSIEFQNSKLKTTQTIFQRFLEPKDYDMLQKQLYERLQGSTDKYYYNEMLAWVFIQKKDYANALRQLMAIDKRNQEDGSRVYRIAEIAANDDDLKTAIKAYDYIVREKGPYSSLYLSSKRYSLFYKRKQLEKGDIADVELARQLKKDYIEFLDAESWNPSTVRVIMELAELEALFLDELDIATEQLEQIVALGSLDPLLLAEAKIQLADYYLMQGEIWESTLLYAQVDKDFEEGNVGHVARFKNARLAYFAGDFEWAQAQFSVLKNSTSKLIANDALDLSIFIMDNLGLDSTANSLQFFSDAEMLIFQNKHDLAFQKLDSLLTLYPDHSLEDDVLYLKAEVLEKERQFEKAASFYQQIIDEHQEEIRADNSMYKLARIYLEELDQPEKAMKLYERLFIEFSGSVFALEAREKYRSLRGDDI